MERSFAVAAAIGGTLDSNPCGISTQTNGRSWPSRKLNVSSRFRSSSQDS